MKPNRWSCGITALAMALDIPVAEAVKHAGHDGGEIVFPHLEEPANRRGFHSQELVRIAWRNGYAMTPIELFPCIMAIDNAKISILAWYKTYAEHWERFEKIIKQTVGILEGRTTNTNHALCNRLGVITDPDTGQTRNYSRGYCTSRGFYPQRLWILTHHGVSL